jgi:malic enzyme
MELAAARAIAAAIDPEHRSPDYVITSVFNRAVAPAVAAAVVEAAEEHGVTPASASAGGLGVHDEHGDLARLQHVVADASE